MGGSDQAKICEQLGAKGEPPSHVRLPTLIEGHCSPVRRGSSSTIAALSQKTVAGNSEICMHAVA